MKKLVMGTVGAAAVIAVILLLIMVVFEDPRVAQGRATYQHYCAGCHGAKGVGNGFNAEFLDPYPRDLSDSIEPYMSEGTNEEIFSAIATGVSGFAPFMDGLDKHVHAHNGDKEEDMSGMEGHDMSEMETQDEGHDMSGMEGHDMSEMETQDEGHNMSEMKGHDDQGMVSHGHDSSSEDVHEEDLEKAMGLGGDDDEAMGSPLMPYWGFTLSDQEMWELVAYIRTLHRHDADPIDFEGKVFDEKRRRPSFDKDVSFPSVDSERGQKYIAIGEKLVMDRYACKACHTIEGEGGGIGPSLDRSGVRLNPKWIYRWIQDPQSIQRDTNMPAFGLPDQQAVAITLYLMTLRAEAEPAE